MKMTQHSTYRRSTATSWTRIDMLLALYDATLFAVERGYEAATAADSKSLLKDRHRTQRLLAELLDGVDVEQGELARNVHRLLTFCLMQTCTADAHDWAACRSILSTLRDAFRDIREQAVALEQSRQIPPLGQTLFEETLAVG